MSLRGRPVLLRLSVLGTPGKAESLQSGSAVARDRGLLEGPRLLAVPVLHVCVRRFYKMMISRS